MAKFQTFYPSVKGLRSIFFSLTASIQFNENGLYFWTSWTLDFASIDIRPLPGALVAELPGVVLGVQDHKKDQISTASILVIGS